MLGDIDPVKTRQTAHSDVVKLREEKGVNEVPAIDGKLRVIDCLLRDLKTGGARAQKPSAASPIQLHLRLAGAGHQIRQIEAKKVVAFDHIGVAFLNDGCEAL